jgi:hypothetical protein
LLNIACKEWASVCAALAFGGQSILVRKGGIHEGPEGFRVAHQRFWLYPTQFHQQPGQLRTGYEHWIEEGLRWKHRGREVPLQAIATVTGVEHLTNEAQLEQLEARTILSFETLQQRFHYREKGLFVVTVSIQLRSEPHWITETPAYAGCKSWVELTEGLEE